MSELGEQQEVLSAPPPNELASVATQSLAAVDVEPFAVAAAHLQMFEKLRTYALKMTKPTDWHLFGERPWPMRGACEKIARALGLNITLHRDAANLPYFKKRDQDDLGAYYIVTVSGKISGQWGELEAFGHTSSRDIFFAWDGKNQEFKPLSQVKEEHLITAAYTNFIANAVMRYTGLSGVTQTDLESVYGVGKVSQHTYAQSAPKKTATDTADRTAKMHELSNICMVMGNGVESEAAAILEALSAFTGKDGKDVPGKRSARDLSDGRLATTLEKARKQWDKFLENAGDQKGFYVDLLKQRNDKASLKGEAQGG